MSDTPSPWLGSLRQKAVSLGMPSNAVLLAVDVPCQQLWVLHPDGHAYRHMVSTSRFGLGEQQNSYQTPRGFHEVVERYGDELPIGSRFVSRVFTGDVIPPSDWCSDDPVDMILSRILRLAGREPGFNAGGDVDSFTRMIYLHGTNHEQDVGIRPSSHGCIRMKNDDIVALSSAVDRLPVWCWIGDIPPPSINLPA